MAKLKREQTTDDIAEIFDVHIKTIQQWARDGCPHDKKRGRDYAFNDSEVQHWLVENNRTAKPGRPKTQQAAANPEETKDFWLARKYRVQCLREEGTLVDRFAYRKAWMDQVLTAKYAFLRLPGEVSGQLVGLDAQDIDRILTDRIESIIRTLADGSADARAGLNPDDKEPSEKPTTTK